MPAQELIASSADSDTYWEGATYLDSLWCCNGDKNYRVYPTGTTPAYAIEEIGSGVTKPPPFKIIRAYLGRLWGMGQKDNRKTLYYSEPAPNLAQFKANSIITLQSQGGNIASAEIWERDMFVFLEHNIVSVPFAIYHDDYREVDLGTGWGCIAPYSLRRCGSHGLVCVSDSGIRAFPSQETLSGLIDRTFQTLDLEFKRASYAFYDPTQDRYYLYICTGTIYGGGGVSFKGHDECWVYDFKKRIWFKKIYLPWRGIGNAFNYKIGRRVISGTYKGRLFRENYGTTSGIVANYTGAVDSAGVNTLVDADGGFPITGNKLKQVPVYIVSGTAAGAHGIISDNTATTLTLDTIWHTEPVAGDIYLVGAMRGKFKSPWITMGDVLRNKRFFELRIVVNDDAVGKYYEITLYRDRGTAGYKIIRGKFLSKHQTIILDYRARQMQLEFMIYSTTGRPEIRSMRLAWEFQRY